MNDIESPLIELYPIKFEYEKTCKKFEWMYEPILPPLNINLILKHIMQVWPPLIFPITWKQLNFLKKT